MDPGEEEWLKRVADHMINHLELICVRLVLHILTQLMEQQRSHPNLFLISQQEVDSLMRELTAIVSNIMRRSQMQSNLLLEEVLKLIRDYDRKNPRGH